MTDNDSEIERLESEISKLRSVTEIEESKSMKMLRKIYDMQSDYGELKHEIEVNYNLNGWLQSEVRRLKNV